LKSIRAEVDMDDGPRDSRVPPMTLVRFLRSCRNAEPFRGRPPGTWWVRGVERRQGGLVVVKITDKWTRSRLTEAAFPLRPFPPEMLLLRYEVTDE
jgi:hypothetical protein